MNTKLAETMLADMMKYYGLSDWTYQFDNAKHRLGVCKYSMRVISLGLHATMVNSEETTLNTILHEIAHALVGSGYGHGPVWKSKAKEIGCDGKRTSEIAIKAEGKHIAKCLLCSKLTHFYRKPKWAHYPHNSYCVTCGKKSTGKIVFIKLDGIAVNIIDTSLKGTVNQPLAMAA